MPVELPPANGPGDYAVIHLSPETIEAVKAAIHDVLGEQFQQPYLESVERHKEIVRKADEILKRLESIEGSIPFV